MNLNVSLSKKSLVTPSGKVKWVKVNTRFDEMNKKYTITVEFENKDDEARMKAFCDNMLAEAKTHPKYEGKTWSADATTGYKEGEDGSLLFTFKTNAFFPDKETHEVKQRYIDIADSHTKKMLGHNVALASGSIVRIMFKPGAYWSSTRINGINLYLEKIAVDKLVEFKSNSDFSAFGFEIEDEENPMGAFDASDEEIPI